MDKPNNIMQAVNMRGLVKHIPSLQEEGGMFGNCLHIARTPIGWPKEVPKPTLDNLVTLAMKIREAVEEVKSNADAIVTHNRVASMWRHEKDGERGPMGLVNRDTNHMPIGLTNHFQFDWLGCMDFGTGGQEMK